MVLCLFLGCACFLALLSIALALGAFQGTFGDKTGIMDKADMFVMVTVYCVGSCNLRRRVLCLDIRPEQIQLKVKQIGSYRKFIKLMPSFLAFWCSRLTDCPLWTGCFGTTSTGLGQCQCQCNDKVKFAEKAQGWAPEFDPATGWSGRVQIRGGLDARIKEGCCTLGFRQLPDLKAECWLLWGDGSTCRLSNRGRKMMSLQGGQSRKKKMSSWAQEKTLGATQEAHFKFCFMELRRRHQK